MPLTRDDHPFIFTVTSRSKMGEYGLLRSPGTSVFVTLPTEALGHGLDIQMEVIQISSGPKRALNAFPISYVP